MFYYYDCADTMRTATTCFFLVLNIFLRGVFLLFLEFGSAQYSNFCNCRSATACAVFNRAT